MVFDQSYYDSIWGSVHRHDYCPYWADRLVHEHGKCRILDIGTGCGYLVKLLREKGCDAWGVDSGEYAIANTCAPGYVLKSSVADLPFSDERFDVVFSNGLWEYLTPDEIAKGAKEIWRVGAKQIHNIDHSGTDFRDDFITWKPLEWWNERLAAPKVLVGCPTHESKEYSHQAWIDSVRKIDYPNLEIFVVDNSPTEDCFNRWREKIPMVHIEPGAMDMAQRLAASMEVMRAKFLSENFTWWFNLESDVICDPATLKLLIKHGCDADWTGHAFPARGGTEPSSSGIGCVLFSRRLIEDFSFVGAGDCLGKNVDGFMWDWVRPQKLKYKVVELWGHLPSQHLREPEGVGYPI